MFIYCSQKPGVSWFWVVPYLVSNKPKRDKSPIAWLPTLPIPALIFNSEKKVAFFMNPSLSILHPTEAAGKTPYWLSAPNREEPSRRIVTAARYLSEKL